VTASLAVLSLFTALLTGNSYQVAEDEWAGRKLVEAAVLRDTRTLQVGDDEESVQIRQLADGRWVLPQQSNLPADYDALKRLVDNVMDAEVRRTVTRRPERMERLDLGERTVRFLDDAGDALLEVEIGRSAEGGGVYAQRSDDESAFLLAESLFFSTGLSSWTKKVPLEDWEDEELEALTVSPRDGSESVKFVRRAKAVEAAESGEAEAPEEPEMEWTTVELGDGDFINTSALDSLIGNLGRLRFQDFETFGNEEVEEALSYQLTYRLQYSSGDVVRLDIGRRPEQILETPAGAEAAEEPETEPAGTAYVRFTFPANSAWSEPARVYAFEISSFNFEQLPENRAALIDAPAPTESLLPPGLAPAP
jgi:hypothetical protein